MRVLLKTILAIGILGISSGCAYLNVKDTLDTDVSQTVLGAKEGHATSHSIAWLVAWGDAGARAAAEDGNIKTINHLDVEYFSILFGLYSSRTTIAYGD